MAQTQANNGATLDIDIEALERETDGLLEQILVEVSSD